MVHGSVWSAQRCMTKLCGSSGLEQQGELHVRIKMHRHSCVGVAGEEQGDLRKLYIYIYIWGQTAVNRWCYKLEMR